MFSYHKHLQVPSGIFAIGSGATIEVDLDAEIFSIKIADEVIVTFDASGMSDLIDDPIPTFPLQTTIVDVNQTFTAGPVQCEFLDANYSGSHDVLPFHQLLFDSTNSSTTNANLSNKTWTTTETTTATNIFITNLQVIIIGSVVAKKYGGTDATTGITLYHYRESAASLITPIVIHFDSDYTFYGTVTFHANTDTIVADIDFVKLFGKPLYLATGTTDALQVALPDDLTALTSHYFYASGYSYD